MHSSRELRSGSFEIRVEDRHVRLDQLFEGFGEHDRLGVVVREGCGAVGASTLITATITAFYDIQRSRGTDFFIYPEYYLFHVGRPRGDHARLDVFPMRKEPVVPDEAEAILEAINDRAITRLVVQDGGRGGPELDPTEVASARSRVRTCLAYSSSGRVAGGNVRITGNPATEGYVQAILDPEVRMAKLREGSGGDRARAEAIGARAGEVEPEQRRRLLESRQVLMDDGRPVETYRLIGLDEALASLASPAVAAG
jgi:hypothetical protein